MKKVSDFAYNSRKKRIFGTKYHKRYELKKIILIIYAGYHHSNLCTTDCLWECKG